MKTFTKEQLVAFGNYLLSKKRRKIVSKEFRYRVTHADIVNFEESVAESGKNKFVKESG